ncbi:MAG TPA: pyruvate ferredoxin oxidoreductase [Euryarchaeota archaeon]|nr:MAG: pyruvate ferredoxin oxidoreductase [Thermoplasmatales archaeon ex4484_6]RLF68477.1 MAG: pyruvate ferredoxin oxidoreductase [Thermoplasmata archaeon]HHD15132.1 pyruvate ferredoxin oxidoreductase [Euryarchaeota archaeon]
MIEIRFHGRGGQGAVVASRIIAEAAFREGKDVQAFPYFGVERRGAPVTAFTKIDDRHIRNKSMIYEPDHVIVLEASLIQAVDVTQGLKKDGMVLVNTESDPDEIRRQLDFDNVAVVNATKIALDNQLGSKVQPIVNTGITGAFARASGLISIESVEAAIMNIVPRYPEKNAKAARDAYEAVMLPGGG